MKTITETPKLGHHMSCVTRTPKMRTNTRLRHSEIKETWWSSVTRLTHGPSSQYCRVEDEYMDNQRPCTSQCQASWTWLVDWLLVYYQDHPKPMNCQILSTAIYATQYDPYMNEYPQGLSTLLTVYLLPETSQGLLDRSHGGRKLINRDNPLIHVWSLGKAN